jgi:hypothetical protein
MILSGINSRKQVVEINTQDAIMAVRTAGSGVIFRGDNWHSFWQGVFIMQKNEVMKQNVSHKYSILSLRGREGVE